MGGYTVRLSDEARDAMDPDLRRRRELVELGMCPYCGAGPFTSPAGHASLKHGVGRRDFRDENGFMMTESVCSKDHAEHMAKRASERLADGYVLPRASSGPKRIAAVDRERRQREGERIQAYLMLNPIDEDRRRRAARKAAMSVPHEERVRRGKAGGAVRSKEWAEKRAAGWVPDHERRTEAACEECGKSCPMRSGQVYCSRECGNRAKARALRTPCGTKSSYRRGCRCDDCRKANTDACRRYREARREN